MKLIKLEMPLVATLCGFVTNIMLLFLLLTSSSVKAVCIVCYLVLSGNFIVNLMKASVCEI